MKELSIEEKAKAYDEAKARMSKAWNNNRCTLGFMNEIFPELKESEDERIRKEIISAIKEDWPGHTEWIAWLEKQGEQNPFDYENIQQNDFAPKFAMEAIKEEKVDNQNCVKPDKVEPKFKVGDSISKKHNSDIDKFGIFTITSIADNKYWYNDSVICDFSDQDLWELVEQPKFKKGDWVFHNTAEFIYMIQTIGRDGYGVISRDGKKSVVYYSAEINYRLWTIQDAKDGDVLVSESKCGLNTWYCIFKSLDDDESMTVHCYIGRDEKFQTMEELCFDKDPRDVKPATKEQRDQLEKAMADAGYTFDFEKKKLKKIEQKPLSKFEVGDIMRTLQEATDNK